MKKSNLFVDLPNPRKMNSPRIMKVALNSLSSSGSKTRVAQSSANPVAFAIRAEIGLLSKTASARSSQPPLSRSDQVGPTSASGRTAPATSLGGPPNPPHFRKGSFHADRNS
jgi:hypothetical protein